MKLKGIMTGIALTALASGAMAAEPTRGFLFEKGMTAAAGTVSVDLTKSVAGARLGFGGSELIINSDQVGFEDPAGGNTGTDGVFKLGFHDGFAGYIGLAYRDDKTEDYFNFKIGVAYTLGGQAAQLTITPEYVIDDARSKDYFNIGAGVHFGLAKMQHGSLNLGVEILGTTRKENRKHIDPRVDVGVRWGVNDRFNVDIVPLSWGATDEFGVPGQVRMNAMF